MGSKLGLGWYVCFNGIFVGYYLPTPPLGQDMTQGQFLSKFNRFQSFPFSKSDCHTKVKEPSLFYYLSIAGGRIIGFIYFLRVLVL